MQELSGLCDIIDLHNFEFVFDPCVEESTSHLPLIFGVVASQVPLSEIEHIAKTTVLETILLLFVPPVKN